MRGRRRTPRESEQVDPDGGGEGGAPRRSARLARGRWPSCHPWQRRPVRSTRIVAAVPASRRASWRVSCHAASMPSRPKRTPIPAGPFLRRRAVPRRGAHAMARFTYKSVIFRGLRGLAKRGLPRSGCPSVVPFRSRTPTFRCDPTRVRRSRGRGPRPDRTPNLLREEPRGLPRRIRNPVPPYASHPSTSSLAAFFPDRFLAEGLARKPRARELLCAAIAVLTHGSSLPTRAPLDGQRPEPTACAEPPATATSFHVRAARVGC